MDFRSLSARARVALASRGIRGDEDLDHVNREELLEFLPRMAGCGKLTQQEIKTYLSANPPGRLTEAEMFRVMNRIAHHQVARDTHPLTCGTDSNHPPLFPIALGGKVVLRCCACDYRQDCIPEGFLKP